MISVLLLVGGIGDGLFMIFFFAALGFLLCYFGSQTANPGAYCLLGTMIPVVITTLFIVFPKGSLPPASTVYDQFAETRSTVFSVLMLMTVVSLLSVAGKAFTSTFP
jgi:hypothetical protein